VTGTRLVGVLTLESLAAAEEDAMVSTVMEPAVHVLERTMSIRRVAELFVQESIDFAPVVEEDRFVGIVTSNMLLKELGRSWDPLTGLSWSDELREWGIEQLRKGNEITILFIDLDRFGRYNKRYGHIVGDKVLRRVASTFRQEIDPEREILVRYGGDEFAIATLRRREEAEELATQLQERVNDAFFDDGMEAVSFAVGVFGGKRTKEREKVHFAATLDNLINLASRDCTERKLLRDQHTERDAATKAVYAIDPPEAPPTPDLLLPKSLRVLEVYADDQEPHGMTTVILSSGETAVSGVNPRMGKSVIESVAIATAKAIERAYPTIMMQVQDIRLAESESGRLVTVAANVVEGEKTTAVGGVEPVDHDLYRSVADATVAAFLSTPTVI
jgi:diguanylate cyclase (GGDEF)-like protein